MNKDRLDQLARSLAEIILEDESRSYDSNAKRDLSEAIVDCIVEWIEDNALAEEDEEEEEEEIEEPKP